LSSFLFQILAMAEYSLWFPISHIFGRCLVQISGRTVTILRGFMVSFSLPR
jgi:hypothetical protein